MNTPAPMAIWYEFASSYSYLAVMRVQAAADAAGVELHWRPFLLGPVFLSLGWNDSPFNIYPPKGRYMWRDMQRLCERYGFPFKMPSEFPRNGLLAARIARLGQEEDWIGPFSRSVMQANFGEDRDIGAPEVISEILDDIGLDADPLIQQAQSDENRKALRAQVEEATQMGLFGAPTFVIGKELFWGNDRLEDALDWATRHPTP